MAKFSIMLNKSTLFKEASKLLLEVLRQLVQLIGFQI